MIAVLRSVGGIVIGVIAAALAYWSVAVAALLAMHGIPLGSAGGPPTSGDLSVHLAAAAAATFAGGRLAARMAGYQPHVHALAVGVLLASGAFLGFSKPSSSWPPWFPYAVASACVAGGVLARRKAASG